MDINKIQTGNKKSNKLLFIILGVVALVGIFLAFVFLGGDSEKEKGENGELMLKNVSEIVRVSEDKNNTIELYNFKKGEVINSVDLSEYYKKDVSDIEDKPLYVMDNQLTKVYVYVPGSIIEINKKDGKLVGEVLIQNEILTNVSSLNLNNDKLLLMNPTTNEVYRYNVETKQMLDTIVLEETASFVTEIDTDIYYLVDNMLHQYSLSDKEVIGSLELIDKPTNIETINNNIYIVSPFGSGLDNGLLMRIDKSEFKIESLIELGKGINNLLTKSSNSSLLYISQNSDEKGASLIKAAATNVMSIDNEVNRENYMEKGVDYLGLLIEETNKGLKIFQLNSEDESFELELNTSYFYAPIL